jgi:hypothetical protein
VGRHSGRPVPRLVPSAHGVGDSTCSGVRCPALRADTTGNFRQMGHEPHVTAHRLGKQPGTRPRHRPEPLRAEIPVRIRRNALDPKERAVRKAASPPFSEAGTRPCVRFRSAKTERSRFTAAGPRGAGS